MFVDTKRCLLKVDDKKVSEAEARAWTVGTPKQAHTGGPPGTVGHMDTLDGNKKCFLQNFNPKGHIENLHKDK